MKVYHQLGFRDNWNIYSYNLGICDGLIFSPINMDAKKLSGLPVLIKQHSFLDPQLYLLNKEKASNITYPFFPTNIKADFSTVDLDTMPEKLAESCTDFQVDNEFEYVVIPSRYYDEIPSRFYELSMRNFIVPFLDYKREKNIQKPFLLSIIVKQIFIVDTEKRNRLLNWITGISGICGVYIIFENSFSSKQIKDFDYLLNVLTFIKILKMNDMEVHVGYCNTEGLLYSAAMPDSITIGSYENLRSFKISRFVVSEGSKRSPNPRLYSTHLLQWMEYNYIQSMKSLIPDYIDYFDDSVYKPLMFNLTGKEYKWHFAKSELYKHYFEVFVHQIKKLPDEQMNRIDCLLKQIENALNNYVIIKRDILLDGDSDDSHLPIWFNVLRAFRKGL